jgi:hypothetical protein
VDDSAGGRLSLQHIGNNNVMLFVDQC